ERHDGLPCGGSGRGDRELLPRLPALATAAWRDPCLAPPCWRHPADATAARGIAVSSAPGCRALPVSCADAPLRGARTQAISGLLTDVLSSLRRGTPEGVWDATTGGTTTEARP